MKKLITIFLCMMMLVSAFSFSGVSAESNSQPPISVTLDHAPVIFDQEPIMVNERTLVPVRAIFEAMGATVAWNANTKTVTSILGDTTVIMVVGNTVMTVNDVPKSLDVPAQIHGDRTLVPVRAVSESFGADVKWISETRTVEIISEDFQERLSNIHHFGCVKKLASETQESTVAFGLEYFDDYNVVEYAPDGTDISIGYTDAVGHISLSVRTDLYTGEDQPLTEGYAKSIAEDLVSVLNKTLISSNVTKFNGTDFMKIKCTAPGIMHGITDLEPDITIYIARKNGVTYTLTYSIYGSVDSKILGDFNYMAQSLVIA